MKATKRVVEKLRRSIARDAKFAVAEWLEQGLPPDAELVFEPTRVPRTMLNYACEKNALNVMKLLIGAGAKADEGKYSKPLFTAVLFGRRNVVKMLLDAGSNPNASIPYLEDNDRGFTPLMKAASCPGSLAMVEYLIKRGADPHRLTQKGNSALSFAVAHGNRPVIARLTKLGCRMSGPQLRIPVYSGDVDTVKLLIRAGADVNETKRGKYGFAGLASLDIAIQERGSRLENREIFAGYGRGGAEIIARSAAEGRRYLQIIKDLIAAGADVNRVTVDDSPLYRATKNGDLEVVKLLLRAGADPKKAVCFLPWTTKLKDTAVEVANTSGFTRIAKLLTLAGKSQRTKKVP